MTDFVIFNRYPTKKSVPVGHSSDDVSKGCTISQKHLLFQQKQYII